MAPHYPSIAGHPRACVDTFFIHRTTLEIFVHREHAPEEYYQIVTQTVEYSTPASISYPNSSTLAFANPFANEG